MTPDAISEAFAPAMRASVAAEEIEGDVVLYDDATGCVHVLNGTAAAIAAALDGVATIAEIVDELVAVYAAPPEQVRIDVLDVVRQLGTQSLLEGVTGDVPPLDDGEERDAPAWLVDPPAR
jgi:hypothetical protein